MDEAFIIMHIGNAELDGVCDEAIVPAVAAAGFQPRRVDRHNTGDLLKSEIVEFIERSQIIVADVTNERPNCYLEIGYAMGLGKKANLILTAREDHHHSSPNFRRDGPKVHFDLEGYDILFWDPNDLAGFRSALEQRVRRRASIVSQADQRAAESPDVAQWRDELRTRGEQGLAEVGRAGYMEVAALLAPPGNWTQAELRAAVRAAEIHNFGWPIAVTLDNRDEYRPRPTTDGIQAEVAIGSSEIDGRSSYDLWKVFRDGRFYTLLSLFEDDRLPNSIFWEVRISRVTEALWFLARLYRRLGASDTDQITVQVRHAGLAGRTLRAANSLRHTYPRETAEESVETKLTVSLIDLETNLTDHVKETVQPLFAVFDFFEVSDEILTEVVDGFINHTR